MDEKEITLKELIKLAPDYLRIQDLDTTPWLYASKDFEVKVDGDHETITKTYRVTDLIIGMTARHDAPKPKSISFQRYGDAETLMCLLAHKPEKLRIAYYHNNQSENMKANSIHMETIVLKGHKGKRTYQISYNTPRATAKGNMWDFKARF